MPRISQHKPLRESILPMLQLIACSSSNFLAPDDELYPVVLYYWTLGLSNKEIVKHAIDHFDQEIGERLFTSSFIFYSFHSFTEI